MKIKALWLAIIGAPIILAGCGGGDSPDITLNPDQPAPNTPAPQEPPEPVLFTNGTGSLEPTLQGQIETGSYRLTLTDTSNNETAGIALVSDTGRVVYALEDRLAFARLQLNASNRFDAILQDTDAAQLNQSRRAQGGRDNTPSNSALTVIGTIIDDDTQRLIETFRFEKQSSDVGVFVSADLAGTYRQTGEAGITTTLTINSNGAIFGTDSTGCQYTGTTFIPTASENLLEAAYTASGCGPSVDITGQQRDGDYRALGRLDQVTNTLTLFSANENLGARFTGTDINAPVTPPPPGPPEFVSENLDPNATVIASLSPGIFDYSDIPLEEVDPENPPELETGVMIVSPTGRIGAVTDRRVIVSKVNVSDVDTFRFPLAQAELVGAPTPSNAEEIFGTPNNQGSGPAEIIGSLLDNNQALVNRYLATRDDAVSVSTFSAGDPSPLAGIYTENLTGGQIRTTWTIATDGTMTGSDNTGCVFNGQTFIPSNNVNVVEFRYTAANCTASSTETGEERDGTYNAVAYLSGPSDSVLRVVAGSDQNIDIYQLIKQ